MSKRRERGSKTIAAEPGEQASEHQGGKKLKGVIFSVP